MRLVDPQSQEVEEGIKRLNGAKVRFPDVPTDVEFHFGYHGLARHVSPELEAGLQEADIFSLETVGGSREGRQLRQEVAHGGKEALHELHYMASGLQKEFWRELHRALFGSQVTVHYPDVPEGHALAGQYSRAVDQELALQDRIEVALALGEGLPSEQELEQATRPLFSINSKREKYMLEHFFPKELPDPDKEELKVVAFFGIVHKGIAVALARQAARQGREDVRVFRNDFDAPFGLTEAYEDFLQQRPAVPEHLITFLTDRFD